MFFFAALTCAVCQSHPVIELDLQTALCSLDLQQQPPNNPAAGVDFVSEDEVLVYTVCHTEDPPTLLLRDDPELSSPHHLRAIILNLNDVSIRQRWDLPTRGRGAMVRVTHSGGFLVVRGDFIQLLSPDRKLLKTLRVPDLSIADFGPTVSPTADVMVVARSFASSEGKMYSSVAILDSNTLSPITQWLDEDGDWRLAATRNLAVRTSADKRIAQIRPLRPTPGQESTWQTVWSTPGTPGLSRPAFVNDQLFALQDRGGLRIFSDAGVMTETVKCPFGLGKLATAREGGVVGYLCVGFDSLEALRTQYSRFVEFSIYRTGARPVSVTFKVSDLNYGSALSPSGSKMAVVDKLRLQVRQLSNPARPTQPAVK